MNPPGWEFRFTPMPSARDLPAYVAELRAALMAARRVVNPVTNENTSRMIDEALGLPVPEPLRPSK